MFFAPKKRIQSAAVLEKRQASLQAEVRAMQGSLADYNIVLDKVNSGASVEDIAAQYQAYKQRNEQTRAQLNRRALKEEEREEGGGVGSRFKLASSSLSLRPEGLQRVGTAALAPSTGGARAAPFPTKPDPNPPQRHSVFSERSDYDRRTKDTEASVEQLMKVF